MEEDAYGDRECIELGIAGRELDCVSDRGCPGDVSRSPSSLASSVWDSCGLPSASPLDETTGDGVGLEMVSFESG